MNYGETITYWYLRLNGFFPLANFVLHSDEDTIERSADTDLLAIRHPHTYEVIGGTTSDWDNETFESWGLNLSSQTISAIIEVKTGTTNRTKLIAGISRAFSRERLLYGVQRIGIWPSNRWEEITTHLNTAPLYSDANQVIAKILIADHIPPANQIPPCLTLSLEDADDFITDRMETYIDQKFASRMFFPSDLMQYIIWKQRNSAD